MDDFSQRLLAWFDRHGRKDLPWQHPRTPYRVWLSEVMLQQTQVRTVIPYFERFVTALPALDALADAPIDRVLALWSGLGYYSRARNLHRAAQICKSEHGGELPCEIDALASLPGIGRSTAGAILAQAFGLRHAILDGNVRRVLARFHGVRGWSGTSSVQRELWRFAEAHTPHERVADYTQAGLMDELSKIRRVLQKLDAEAPHEVLLVIDGTTGQNAISQTRQFQSAIGVTGLVVTKLDGTAKGGIVFALAREFGLPIRYVGLGESAEDLRVFDAAAFVDGLLPAKLGDA
jgi:endonuclease III